MTTRSLLPTLEAAIQPPSIHTKSAAEVRRDEFSPRAADMIASGAPFGESQLANIQNASPRAAIWALKFREADLKAVRMVARSAKSPVGRFCAVSVSKLGDGWFYPILAVLIFTRWGLLGYRIIALATLNASVIHCLYPAIKRHIRRMRPYEVDSELPCLLATLDEHSFPSGHAMTLTGVFVPIVILWPAMTIAAVLVACCLSWSRVATAHHYPSDVLAGILLGAGIGYPISVCAISVW